jgi:hypothetical protein
MGGASVTTLALTRGDEVAQRPQRLLREVAPTLGQLRPGGAHERHQHPHQLRRPAFHPAAPAMGTGSTDTQLTRAHCLSVNMAGAGQHCAVGPDIALTAVPRPWWEKPPPPPPPPRTARRGSWRRR